MSSPSQVSSGVIHDVFILLSRPITLVSASMIFVLCSLVEFPADHPLIQVAILFIWAGLLARMTIAAPRQRWSIFTAFIGLSILILSFLAVYQGAGKLTLIEGELKESYLRGTKVAVDHHLGGAVKLSTLGDKMSMEMVGREQITFSPNALAKGLSVELDEWRFSLEKIETDPEQPRTRLTVKPRANLAEKPISQVLTLSEGQSISPDGQTLITALNISGDRGGVNAPNLGAGAELLLKWGEGQMQRAWVYVNPPRLDQKWGNSPLIIEQLEVIPNLRYHWRVQRRASLNSLFVGLIFLLIACGLSALHTIRKDDA